MAGRAPWATGSGRRLGRQLRESSCRSQLSYVRHPAPWGSWAPKVKTNLEKRNSKQSKARRDHCRLPLKRVLLFPEPEPTSAPVAVCKVLGVHPAPLTPRKLEETVSPLGLPPRKDSPMRCTEDTMLRLSHAGHCAGSLFLAPNHLVLFVVQISQLLLTRDVSSCLLSVLWVQGLCTGVGVRADCGGESGKGS